jgi:hypothetical protein
VSEAARLDFIIKRDGLPGAIDFAKRTMTQYRRCVLMDGKNGRKFHFASTLHYRPLFIASYLCFKRFISDPPARGEEG